jgi:hypothetical protein
VTVTEWHALRDAHVHGLTSRRDLVREVMESGSDGTFEMDAVVSALKEVA